MLKVGVVGTVGTVGIVVLVVGVVGVVGVGRVPGVPVFLKLVTKVPTKPLSFLYYQVITPAFQPIAVYP